MASPPSNPFSSGVLAHDGGGDADGGNNFEAFALSPVSAANSSPMPSLQSIQLHEQQQQQMQMQQQQLAAGIVPAQQQPAQQQQQLKFESLPSPQELSMSGPMNDSSGGGGWPPPPPVNSQTKDAAVTANAGSGEQRSFLSRLLTCGGMCSVEALRPYFDVDTADVVVRIRGAVKYCATVDGFRNEVLYSDNALRLAYRDAADVGGGVGPAGDRGVGNDSAAPDRRTSSGKGPDLYGPVWITLTLVFFVAVTSNMSLYLHHKHGGAKSIVDEGGAAAEEEWDYDVNQLLRATWMLYSFSVGLPCTVYFVLKLVGVGGLDGRPGLAELVCLYGYSLVPYLPAAWLCVVPANWLRWLVLAGATAMSGTLVLKNIAGPILDAAGGGAVGGGGVKSKSGGLIMCLVGCHFVFFLVLKLAFYHHS